MKQQSLATRGECNHNNNNNNKRTQGELKMATDLGLQQQLLDKNDDDHSSNSSSSSSTVSSSSQQQQSSVDYEAEDENEDRQQRRPKHTSESDNLLHVQNFLKCFGPNAYAKPNVPATTKALGRGELRAWRQNYRSTINTVPPTGAAAAPPPTDQTSQTATTAINPTSALFQAQSQSSSGHKPPTTKFQINTKFLRKPRNKLMKMLPTATAATATATAATQSQPELEPPEQLQLLNDDSNAKFKDFSIDSLLNK